MQFCVYIKMRAYLTTNFHIKLDPNALRLPWIRVRTIEGVGWRHGTNLILSMLPSTKPNIEVSNWIYQTKIQITHIAYQESFQSIPPFYTILTKKGLVLATFLLKRSLDSTFLTCIVYMFVIRGELTQGIKGKQPVPHSNSNVRSNTALKVLSSKPKYTRRF